MQAIPIVKANAYGNDFLLAPDDGAVADPPSFTRAACARHLGIGADGLILFTMTGQRATMRLWNADGSPSELSGNGLRCLAAHVARVQDLRAGSGRHRRHRRRHEDARPRGPRRRALHLPRRDGPAGGPSRNRAGRGRRDRARPRCSGWAIPQCIVLGALPSPERFNRLGPALATHSAFPAGTNVEFVEVEAPDRVRILIWERGVGPTTSSGTGSSASAVAAAAHGGAGRDLDVVAPGGTQRVEWTPDGVFLTGWAHVVLDGTWTGGRPRCAPSIRRSRPSRPTRRRRSSSTTAAGPSACSSGRCSWSR